MARARARATNGTSKISDLPEGFDINVGRERGEGWAKKESGNTIFGRLLGRYAFRGDDGKQRAYYQVQLAQDCKAETTNPEDEDGERIEVLLGRDSIVNIDEIATLADLAPYTEDGGVYDVWIRFREKVQHKGGRSIWRVDGPKLRMVKAPPKRKSEDEIPF